MNLTQTTLSCAVCGSERDLRKIEDCPPFSLYHCAACDAQFCDPLQNPGHSWYEDEDLDTRLRLVLASHRRPDEMLREPHRHFLRDLPARGGRLFDIGCAEGGFLAVASRSYDVTGIDFNRKAIEISRKHYGLSKTHAMTLEEFVNSPFYDGDGFDVISLFDVIEHVEAPAQFLQQLQGLLAPGGWLALNTPNRERSPNFKERWDYPPHHLTRWSKEALRNLLSHAGLSVVRLVDYTDPGYLSVAWMDRLPVARGLKRALVGDGKQGELGSEGFVRSVLLDSLSKIRYRAAKLVDRPVLWALKMRRAPGQMLYCVAQKQ